MKNCLLILLFVLISGLAKSQFEGLHYAISAEFENNTLAEVLDKVHDMTQLNFTYSTDIIPEGFVVTASYNQMLSKDVLKDVLGKAGLRYILFNKQIIVKRQVQQKRVMILQGKVFDKSTGNPIPFASVSIVGKQKGIVCDGKGCFEYGFDEQHLNNILRISAMGYIPELVKAKAVFNDAGRVIFLKQKSISLDTIHVIAKTYNPAKMGNKAKFALGSLYIDTHGQQTALFVENQNQFKGIIHKVNYFLSKKGNTHAPFRVRLYALDSIEYKPGKDLLPELLIIKPSGKSGWYSVDISGFQLKVPEIGFFVAIEGIFPNDLSAYTKENSKRTTKNISYGQRLGYSRRKGNNTWHFGLDYVWYQIDKRNYNVLISVDIDRHEN